MKTATRKTSKTSRKTLARAYGPDTKGQKLPEIDPKLSATKQKAKDRKTLKAAKQQKATEYAGAPIQATKLFSRKMTEFKNTEAECLLAINTVTNTYTFMNTYKGGILPASYNPESYTYSLTEKSQKKLDKKIEEQGFQEIDRPEWPTFVAPAAKRKAK